jgi:ubiquinone/menaquinone biosynthesis C-methylase UbiE
LQRNEKTSTILNVMDTWDTYFDTMDEGIGTTYERFILHRYFEKIKDEYGVNSILEVPSFGMTGVSGINSLWWAKAGIQPVVIDTDSVRIEKAKNIWNSLEYPVEFKFIKNVNALPFPDKSFDLSWNFASLWFVQDLEGFFTELRRITKKVIFICIPNRFGLGYIFRNLIHSEEIENLYLKNIHPKYLKTILKNLDLPIKETGYLDVPPWPDIAMKKEEMLKKIGLGFILKKNTGIDDALFEKKCIVDYFNGTKPNLEKDTLKYDFLENAPSFMKLLWGHHRYFIIDIESNRV